jgi:hypothetical protein
MNPPRFLALMVLSLWLPACSSFGAELKKDESASSEKGTKEERAAPPVVGHLETRGHLITITVGKDERPRYTIRTREGEVLAEALSAEEVRAEAPELHKILKDALAGAERDKGAFLDAAER